MKRAIASIDIKTENTSCLTAQEWWNLQNYAKLKKEIAYSGLKDIDKLDLFNIKLFNYAFNENGITVIENCDGGKTFALVADVHS